MVAQTYDKPLRVGILNAIDRDESKIVWQDSPAATYIRFLQRCGGQFEYTALAAASGELPSHPDEYDAYVITGSPSGVYDSDPWIGELSSFVRASFSAGRRLVGMCFGHQLLAHSLGGRAQRASKGWGLGRKKLDVYRQAEWMREMRPEIDLYFAHQDQVVDLPPGAELLAGNGFVPIGMYQLGERVLGIQGHPEFDLRIMDQIVGNLGGRMPEEERLAAERSLRPGQPDGDLAGRWIVDFLNR